VVINVSHVRGKLHRFIFDGAVSEAKLAIRSPSYINRFQSGFTARCVYRSELLVCGCFSICEFLM